MDPIDRLARKLIDSFEHLEDHLLLEQLTVPEDLSDPEDSVEEYEKHPDRIVRRRF